MQPEAFCQFYASFRVTWVYVLLSSPLSVCVQPNSSFPVMKPLMSLQSKTNKITKKRHNTHHTRKTCYTPQPAPQGHQTKTKPNSLFAGFTWGVRPMLGLSAHCLSPQHSRANHCCSQAVVLSPVLVHIANPHLQHPMAVQTLMLLLHQQKQRVSCFLFSSCLHLSAPFVIIF